ncbi:MAG: hypothetical protein AB8G18_07195 [Gammaproteobacteria bacterium]
MRKVYIDFATLRSAYSMLYRGDHSGLLQGASSFTDLDIIALSTVLENIVLFDEVLVGGLSHVYSEQLAGSFGPAIKHLPAGFQESRLIEQEAMEWVSNITDFSQALYLLEMKFVGAPIGSDGTTIAIALGFAKNQSETSLVGHPNVAARDDLTNFLYHADMDGLTSMSGLVENENFTSYIGEDKANLAILQRGKYFQATAKETSTQLNAIVEDALQTAPGFNSRAYDIRRKSALEKVYWGLYRARCYELYARIHGLDYCPHPLRARACLASRVADFRFENSAAPSTPMDTLDHIYKEGIDVVNELTNTEMMPLPIAPVFPYIVSKCRTKSELLDKAYEIRESSEAKNLRASVTEIEASFASGNVKEALEYTRDLQNLQEFLRADIGIQASDPTISIAVFGVNVPIPSRLTGWASSLITSPKRRQLLFLRSIFHELTKTSRLGKYYDFLLRDEDDARYKSLKPSNQELVVWAEANFQDLATDRSNEDEKIAQITDRLRTTFPYLGKNEAADITHQGLEAFKNGQLSAPDEGS